MQWKFGLSTDNSRLSLVLGGRPVPVRGVHSLSSALSLLCRLSNYLNHLKPNCLLKSVSPFFPLPGFSSVSSDINMYLKHAISGMKIKHLEKLQTVKWVMGILVNFQFCIKWSKVLRWAYRGLRVPSPYLCDQDTHCIDFSESASVVAAAFIQYHKIW